MVWRLFCLTLLISIALLGYGIYTIVSAQHKLFDVPPGYIFGPEEADLTVVEFFDFGCEPCRLTHPAIMDAVKQDGNVKYIPLPVAPPKSTGAYAMKLTYAAELQGKYREVFQDLIENYRTVDESNLTDVALKSGIDPVQLKEDAASPQVQAMVDKSGRTYIALGVGYTPTFFIGSKIQYVPQSKPTAADFLRMFAEARGEKS